MKTCTSCGLDLDDRYLFCTQDGSQLSTYVEWADDIASPAAILDANRWPSPAPVLCCPACGGEYPLSFLTCPADGLKLTRERITVSMRRVTRALPIEDKDVTSTLTVQPDEVASEDAAAPPGALDPGGHDLISACSPEADREPSAPTTVAADPDFGWSDEQVIASGVTMSQPRAGRELFSRDGGESTAERPGFRVAAIMIAAALGVFLLMSAYTFLSVGSGRRPGPPLQASTQATLVDNSILVPTPESARDYAPPPRASEASRPSGATERSAGQKLEPDRSKATSTAPHRADSQRRSSDQEERARTAAANPPADAKRREPVPQPVRNNEAYPVPLTQPGDGLISARPVRIRASRTPSGFRYDLTFSLRELTGRALSWERLLITTRASSGISQSQIIPFSHRLGGAGTLTFTVGVEMRGSGEADWRGRVAFTGLGSYDSGRLIRTSFGADVSPW